MTLAGLQNGIDTVMANKWAQIVTIQNNFKSSHSTYWQGCEICSTIPADGAVATEDRATSIIRAGFPAWNATSIPTILGTINCSLRCDEYIAPDGSAGFVITVTFVWAGVTWMKSWQNGPDTSFATAWHQVIPIGG